MLRSLRCLSCAVLLTTLLSASAQEHAPLRCSGGSGIPAADMQRAQAYAPDRDATRYVQLRVIIGSQPGPGGDATTTSKVQRDLDGANALYAHNNTGIQFVLCGPIQVIDDQDLYDQFNYDPNALDPYHEPGFITVVYEYYLLNGMSGYNTNDQVFLSSYFGAPLLAHELGHALGLMHTHDPFIPEFADGSNCAMAGDFICDTPAEPDLSQPGLVDRTDCSYIGTLTDPHGDPYHPLMGNIMSYAPCDVDTFTPGQTQVMLYTLDNVKIHLHRTVTPSLIAPFDTRVCRPGSVQLSATPAPGVFSGDLVDGSTISVPQQEPAGLHAVTYTPDATPDSSAFVDQSMIMFTFVSWAYPSAQTSDLVQTFHAGANGRFTSLDLLVHDPTANTYELRLFRGVAPNTTLIATSVLNSPGITDTAWVNFPFAGNVPVIAGQNYTFELIAGHAVRAMISGGGGSSTTDYMHGTSNLVNPNADAVFRTWVYAVPPCLEAVRYYEVYDPPTYPVTSLAHTYCPDENTPVPLIGEAPGTTDGHFLVDGSVATSIIPSTLSEGAHNVAFVNTTFGCTDTSAYTFSVARPTAVITDLAAPLCADGDAFTLTADPPGGTFTIDGSLTAVLDPAALGTGAHTAIYTFNGPVDSVAFTDQSCCGSAYAHFSDYTTLAPGASFWQSFVPAFSGRLDSVTFVVTADVVRTYRYAVRLFEGDGTTGTVIGNDTVAASSWNSQPNLSGELHPDVVAGQAYTLRVERLADTVSVDPYVYYFRDNSYTSGTGDLNALPQADLRFSEYVSANYACDGTTEVPFTIEVCTGIAEQRLSGLSVAPNPFTDAFTLRSATDLRYTLLNSVGAEVRSGRSAGGTNTSIDASGLAAGTYLLRCTDASGFVRTLLLVRAE